MFPGKIKVMQAVNGSSQPDINAECFKMEQQSIQRVIEVDLDEVRSPKYYESIENTGEFEDTCFLCGKRIKDLSKSFFVHYTTNNTIVSYDGSDLDISQGFFPVGNECKKKLQINFAFKP